MASEKFTLDESMAAGWKLLLENFWTFIGLAGLAVFLSVLPDLASSVAGLNPDWFVYTMILGIVGFVLKFIVQLGIFNLQIRIVNGQPVSSNDIWTPAGKFWAYIGATLIYMWVVGFGLCFLVVPGIIFGIMFQFYPYFLVEHRLGPIKALKASAAITSGVMWELFFLGLLLAIISGLSVFAFIIGIVPAVVFSKLTMTHVYKTLLDNTPADQLPFPYEPGRFARGVAAPPAWDASMGYDEPAAQISQEPAEDAGVTLHTPESKEAQTVDKIEPENDKTHKEF